MGLAGVAIDVRAMLAVGGGVLQVAQLAQFFEVAAGGLDFEPQVAGDALDGGVTQAVGHLAVAPDDAVDGGGDQAQFARQGVADGGEGVRNWGLGIGDWVLGIDIGRLPFG